MDFYEVVKNRRSIRKYKPEIVPRETLLRILEAARLAPTWANMEGVRYVVVQEKYNVKNLAEAIGQGWAKNAPMFIVVCIAPKNSGNANGIGYYTVDAAICMEHLILAATNEGLGTCWIGHFDEQKVKQVIGIEKDERVIAVTPLGFPLQIPSSPSERKDLSKLVYSEKFKNKMIQQDKSPTD
jgi:nitroreductase